MIFTFLLIFSAILVLNGNFSSATTIDPTQNSTLNSNQDLSTNLMEQTTQTTNFINASSDNSQTVNSQSLTTSTIAADEDTDNTSKITADELNNAAGNPSVLFNEEQISGAATWVKNYIENNHSLPDYVTIDGNQVSMPSFLELLTTTVLKIKNGDSTPVEFITFGPAPTPRDEIKSGDMSQTEYLAIAANVKSFMDSRGVAPEYAYNTSLGLYFSYQNLVYTYAKILDTYQNTNSQNLPTTITIKPWKFISDPNAATFTLNEVTTAATWVKNYVDAYLKLPNYVTINGTTINGSPVTKDMNMPSFLELLTTSVLLINNGTGTTVDYTTFGVAPTPRDTMQSGDMAKAEYLAIAANVKSFMDRTGVAPEYAYNTSLGLYFGYQNLVYTYAKILDTYGNNGVLPTYISLKPWSLVINPPVTFTIDQITSAAITVKTYVEVNNKLPDYVTIGTTNVTMPSFLELLTTSVLQINNGTGTTVDYLIFGVAPTPRDSMQSGDMSKTEYLTIAANVKSFIDNKKVAPEYAYNTSLGLYFSYQNLVYTYAKILDSYGTNGLLPAYISLKPWSLVINPPVSFSIDQLASAATVVKNYVEANSKLPDYVTIGTTNVAMPSFLELLTTTVLQINNGTGTTVDYLVFGTAPTPKDTMQSGYMAKIEYLAIAANVKSFIDNKKVAPEYAYNTSLGLYFSYQNLVYTYAKILDTYATNKALPTSISVKAWSSVITPPTTFTTDQITNTATTVKTYIDTNHKLPDYVTIGTTNVTMPSFLELLTTTVLQINNGTGTTVDYLIFATAPTPRDTMQSGDMAKTEYLAIAANVKSFMDNKKVAPEYAYNTSLGLYFGYQNLVYTYAKILDTYNTNKALPTTITINPWKLISDPNAATFDILQVAVAASWIKNYVENNYKLPDYVTMDGVTLNGSVVSKQVNMPSFLKLLTSSILQIKMGDSTPIDLLTFGTAPNPRDEIKSGNMPQTEYLKIAADIENFMDTHNVAPEYAYNTSLGLYFGYQNLVYTYAKILDTYHTTNPQNLPNTINVNPWTRFNVDLVVAAACWVKNYVDLNHSLPGSVNIYGSQVSMPSFLKLLTTAVLKIKNNDSTPVDLVTFNPPNSPREEIKSGNMPQSEYLQMAYDIENFMNSHNVAPEYTYNSSLGLYFSYQNMVYMYAKILDFYSGNKAFPDSVAVDPWWGWVHYLGSTDYGEVVKMGPFGNVDSPVKIAYIVGVHPLEQAAHQAMIEAVESYDPSLKYCYYIYIITVTKDAADYENGRMNGQLLANRFAVPDIINQGFQLAIDIHSNVGNWEKTRFIFSPVGGTKAEAIAWNIKNRISWLSYYFPPSQTSPPYVTVPLIQAGIPAVVYETYYYDAYAATRSYANEFVLVVDSGTY